MSKTKKFKFLILIPFSLMSLNALADGYINENMLIFTSSSDGSDDPWKEHPKCIAIIQPAETAKTWTVQYTYADNKPLTSPFITTQKPSTKPNECENKIHFPDNIVGSGIFESFYPNGKKRSRIEYTDGTYQGKLEFWFANGLKEQESYVLDGSTTGDYKMWHPNGQLALSMKYKSEQVNGMKQRWYENGEPWTYVRFENGVMIGELKQWFQNQKLERQGQYRNGLRQGEYKIWFNDGTPEAILNYQAGKIISGQCWSENAKALTLKKCINNYGDEE